MWILKYLIDIAIPMLSAYLASDDAVVKWLIKNHFLAQNLNCLL
jgi:hypothetical protein